MNVQECNFCHRTKQFYEEILAEVRAAVASEIEVANKRLGDPRRVFIDNEDIQVMYATSVLALSEKFNDFSIETVLKDLASFVVLDSHFEKVMEYYARYLKDNLGNVEREYGRKVAKVSDIRNLIELEPLNYRWNNTRNLESRVAELVSTFGSLSEDVDFYEYDPGPRIFGRPFTKLPPNDKYPLAHVREEGISLKSFSRTASLSLCPVCYKLVIEALAGTLQRFETRDWDDDD